MMMTTQKAFEIGDRFVFVDAAGNIHTGTVDEICKQHGAKRFYSAGLDRWMVADSCGRTMSEARIIRYRMNQFLDGIDR